MSIVVKHLPNELVEYIIEFIPFYSVEVDIDNFINIYQSISNGLFYDMSKFDFEKYLENLILQIHEDLDEFEDWNDEDSITDTIWDRTNDYRFDGDFLEKINLSWILRFYKVDGTDLDFDTIYEDYDYHDASIKRDLIRLVVVKCINVSPKDIKLLD